MANDLDRSLAQHPVCAEAISRYNDSAEASEPQRKSILAAKNFRAGNQWPDDVRQQRQGAPSVQGVAAQPPRPCLTIDRVSQPVRQVSNVVRQSNFAIDCLPVGDGADKATAEIFKGWMRRVQNESRGDSPIEWAADGAAEGGIGWFRLTAYETNTDLEHHPFDQDLRIDRVTNSLSVYPDPHAVKPTRADMRYLLVTEDIPRDEFSRLWSKADMTSLDAFRATGDTGGWVTDKTIRIAEYWRVEYDEVRIVETVDGQTFMGDAIPKDLPKASIKRERIYPKPLVKWSKITATEELQSTDWLGTRIPFIPVIGEELNVDGKPVLRGVIQPAMDAQRMVNYTFSAAVESAALAPKSPWLVAEGQTDDYKQIWQTANTQNHSVLPYKPTSLLGQPVQPPQRNSVEQPIQAMVELMMHSQEAIKATTGIFDPSLGNSNPRERSGKAIEALQGKSDFGQSNYQDNVMRAVIYAGELMVELGPKLLDRPGRIIQILQLDDTAQQVMLGQPFVPGENGIPQPLQTPTGETVTDPTHAHAVAQIGAGLAKFYDLTAGKYSVTVAVGRNHLTKRQEYTSALGELIPHLPPPMQAVLTPEYIQTLDFGGSEKVAEIARKTLPPQLQQATDSAQAPLPPAVQQQLAQIPMLQQALQDAKKIIDTKATEKRYDLQKTKLEITGRLLEANVNNAAKILVARIGADKQVSDPAVEADEEAKAAGIQHAHEAHEAAKDRAHELMLRLVDQQHERDMSDQEHAQALAQAAAQPEPAGAPA